MEWNGNNCVWSDYIVICYVLSYWYKIMKFIFIVLINVNVKYGEK